MAQEITLPVKLQLENLQSIMKEMRSQLGTLKVDSSGYKKLEGVINGIEKRIQDIQVIASRPIMDGKQFVAIEKDVSHIYDDITKLGMEAGKIKFSDLQLTGDQKAKLQEFDNQLKIIKDDLKNIEQKAKEAFLSTDAGKLWQEQNPEQATKSFSRITDIIETEVLKQKKAVEDAKKAYEDYQNTIQISKNINSFMRSKNSLTDRIKAAGMYDKIFTADGSRFKNGGRNALEDWLRSEFSLSDDAIKSITQGSGAQVLKAFTEMKDNVRAALKSEQNRLSAERKNAIDTTNNGKTLTDRIANEEAKQQSIQAVQNAATQATEARAQAEAHLRQEEEAAQAARSAYITGLTKETQAQLKMGNSCEQAKAQLASLSNTVKEGQAKLASLDSATSRLQGISNFVNRYVGVYAIIRKVTTAIRNAFNNIKELDKTITSIAVVTNMSQEDLWNKVGQYTQMAQEYGVETNDVYKVSQLFYQQGLQTSQVMSLTTETLKMAKIAGMDYTQATNAMTVAVRAFNIEMGQAQQVTDTYSALAAKFAVSSAEIANAMEKTASSAANVGMSIQSTSAFMSVMIQTTRESAQNIGSALKSIISRYGEMKASPASLINVDGEEVAFNKVDTALKSIGISIKDASGQFRDFDDVIMELAAKWDTLDNNTQRYIATVMAGNRQQSRFIALVSNYDELSRAMNVANNAENASIVQVAKTMDSLESKANQLKNAFSQLYLDLHIESGLKDIYDWLTRIITTVGKLGTLSGAIPTLMNIFGFGSGTKKIFNEISNSLQQKKLTIETDNTQFQKEKEEIEAFLAKQHDLNITVQVNDSQLQATENRLIQNEATRVASTMIGMNGSINNIDRLIADLIANQSKLSNTAQTKEFLEGYGFNDSEIAQLTPVLEAFSRLGQTVEDTSNKVGELGTSAETGAQAENNKTQAVETNTQTTEDNTVITLEQAQAEQQAAQEAHNQAVKEQAAAQSADELTLRQKDHALQLAANTLNEKNKQLADIQGLQAKQEETNASHQTAAADEEEAAASKKVANSKGGWAGKETGLKITGIATGAARMLGTAVTAAGAAHQNQVGESFLGYSGTNGNGVELSKMYTGLGNGLSMAGTGASMLMTLGPWGAAIGAIGGFLIGGLGALIDGATMTLEEQLAIEKEAAKKASDDALKASAKSADLSNQIDNIKQLQKAMYNSTEDMQAYKDAMNTMASEYPALVGAYDEAGNAIIDLNQAEVTLMQTRLNASIAANQAAKAEAQTRKTTIDILHEAQNTITEGTNRVGTTLKDRSGKAQSFKDSNNWWQVVDSARDAGNDVTNWTLNDYIDYLNAYSGNNGMIKAWKQKFENVSITDNGEIFLGDLEYGDKSGIKEYKQANEVLKNHATDLNITKASDVDEDMAYIYGFMGWDKTIELTAERIEELEKRLSERIQGYEKLVATLDEQLPITDAQESLDYALLDKDTEKAAKISTSKIAAKLIANQLTIAAKEKNLTAGQWSRIEDEQLASEYEDVKTSATDIVVEWLTGLSNDALDKTLAAFSSMSSYRSLDDLLKTLGFDDTKDFIDNSGLDHDDADKLIKGWQQSFIDANKANRDRIINTIYSDNGQGWELNNELKGLAKFTNQDNNSNFALDIAYKFKAFEGQSKIISDYADYFTDQLLDINELAENGYTNLAKTRLSVLSELADTLSQIDDSEVQKDLFATITSIDFSNYDTIVKAIDNIKSYEQTNGVTAQTTQLLAELDAAKNKLIFNVNTLVQDLTESITSSAKEMNGVLGTNRSGLDLSKALDELASINATRDTTKLLGFDDIFEYDATLNQYVYKQNGLIEAIKLREGQLQEKVTQLGNSIKNYLSKDTLTELKTLDPSGVAKNFDKNVLVSFIDTNTQLSEQSKTLYENLAQQFIDAQQGQAFTWEQFIDYLIQQGEDVTKLKALSDEELAAYTNNKKNQLYQNIDWASLALGTDYFGTNQTLLKQLAPLVGKTVNDSYEDILEAYLNTIKNESVRETTRAKINDEIIQTKTNQYQTAISEIINYSSGQTLSQATKDLFNNAKVAEHQIANNAETAILTAKGFLEELAKSIGQAGYTLEQYNQDAKSILEATLNNGSKEKSLLDFISEDSIGADTLEGLANVFGKRLDELVDVATGQVQGQLGQYMSYDFLAGKYNINSTFEQFIEALQADFRIIIQKGTKQYIEALKTWNERVINENNEIHKAVSEELNTVLSAKAGDQLNLAQTFGQLGDKVNQELLDKLTEYGADFSSGILTIREGANIPAIVQELSSIAAENGLLIPEELRALTDAINAVLDTMVSNIKSGIKGSLSVSGARDLTTWAKNNLKIDLDFTRTKEGLKLSTEQAEQLYNELVKVDSISAQIVLDELNESIEESVTSAKELKGIMREVAEIRATTESDDFKFMDHDIPSGQNNPINYLENWSKAFKTMNEAGKAGGKMKNMMDYTDFYNIITEMGNLAQQTGEIKLSGDKVLHNCQDAADLIEAGAAALSVAADGSIKVDLSQLGIDFSTGASDLKANVGKGIQEVAQSQVEMLDSMIQLLETIVAMEELGNIDVEGNGIDLGEMFVTDSDGKLFLDEDGYAQWQDGMQKAAEAILKQADDMGKDSDLYKGLENVKVNDVSLRKIFEDAKNGVKLTEDQAQSYYATVKAFYAAMQSGNYDLDNIMASIKEVLAGTGFEGEIQIGDQTLVFAQGQTLIKLEDGSFKGAHTDDSYPTAAEAVQAEALVEAGVKEGDIIKGDSDSEGNYHYKGSMKIDQTEFEVTLDENNKPTYTSNGQTFDSQYAAAQYAYKDYSEHAEGPIETYAEWSVRVFGKFVAGEVKIENEAEFQARTHEQIQELAEAMANGSGEDIQVAAEKIGIKVELTNGEVLEEQRQKIAEITGIEDKNVVLNIAGDTAKQTLNDIAQTLETIEEEHTILLQTDTAKAGIDELKTKITDFETKLKAISNPPTKIKIEADSSVFKTGATLDQISKKQDVIKEKSPLQIKITADDKVTDTLDDIIKYQEDILNNNPIELKLDQDITTNDATKAQLDSINELLKSIRTNPEVEIRAKLSQDSDAKLKLDEIIADLENIISKQVQIINVLVIDLASGTLKAIADAVNNIPSSKSISVSVSYSAGSLPGIPGLKGGTKMSTGNVGLARATGTLMGELGPELVVQNNRYFVAGQNGAEFVDLAKDAIVFNHLQTEQLLKNGMSPTRGKAVTSEHNAVAYAHGNLDGGPAMASARAALSALKQLRAQWNAIAKMGAKDLAGLGGSGSGGGGGGASAADPAAFAAFVREVERWYDYLQEIATLEEKINREEAKREKYQSSFLRAGKEYAKSNLETLKYLREEAVTHQALADAQQEYFDKRREELNTQGAFKDLYTFDENGQLKYNPDLDKNGQKGGLAFLADLLKRDDKGKSKYSVEQQYNILSKYWGDQMKYDSSGNEIVLKADATEDERNTFYANSVQALFDLIDSQQAEMQSLHDSINEHELAVIENQTAANEIMQEIEDNQISVEDKVLDAVISQREQEIDDAQKTRDAIEEASNHLIDGLNTQLDKEREMYDTQNGQQELSRLQSQLAILRSSGGSGSEIANLQKEIASRQKDMYFEAQEQQIAALQEASQNELDRLDAQIDLMNETLEYEKENGLLWNYVYQVMAGTSEEITNFILTYDKQYWGQSPTRDTQTYRQTLFEVDQMIGYKEGMSNGFDEVVQGFSDYAIKKDAEIKNGDKNAEKNATSKAEDYHNTHLPAAPNNSGGGGDNGSGGNSPGGGGGGKKVVATSYQDAGNSGHKVHVVYSDGTSSEKLEAHNWDKKVVTGGTKTCYCSKCNHYMGVVYPGSAHFSQGGMIDYTGPAMVHGSKSKPESVLNAEQTKILRDNILSNKPNSLISLLQAYNSGYDSNALVPNTGESIIIEQATVEMNVAQISNDYDAQRAGEQALERMVQIARKSQRQNRVGR